MRSMASTRPWLALAPCAVAAMFLCGCSASPGSTNTVSTVTPSLGEFVGSDNFAPGVLPFLGAQCGTLDCHGQVGRPFRLYSVNGLRLPNDAGLIPGAGALSTAEQFADYLSAVEIEPEEMTRVMQGQDPATKLLLVKKPMGLERHKGGTRITPGDNLYTCLVGWLTPPLPDGGTSFSDPVIAACQIAAGLM